MKKFAVSLLVALSVFITSKVQAQSGAVTLAWNDTNAPATTFYKIYKVSGTNVVFTAGNTNIVLAATTTINSGNQITVSNLNVGAWSFAATANSTVSGYESVYSSTAWTNIFSVPSAPTLLRIISVQTP